MASKLLEYCSPPGPHIPYISAKAFKTPAVQEKLAEITKWLEEISSSAENPLVYDYGGKVLGGANLALAITTPTETVYTFNHGLRESLVGKNPWNEHTVFRIASVSKALTVWEIINLGIGWDEKVVVYLPELIEGRYKKEWSEVTVGALAGYAGGAIRDFEHDVSLRPQNVPKSLYKRDESEDGSGPRKRLYFREEDIYDNVLDIDGYVESIWTSYLPDFHPSEAWKMGFPPLDNVDVNRCFYNCTSDDFLRTLANHPLVYPTYTSPAYSNVGFSLLGLILERRTGLSFDMLMKRDMYDPLGMKDTFHKLPPDNSLKPEGWGAHPFWGANNTWHETREIWGGWGTPAGGIYTSSHDLSIFLRSILAAFPYSTDPTSFPNKHLLLPPEKVREWLTPTSFTGGKTLLGRPWEIKRKKIPGCHGGRAVTLYTKAGGGTGYNAGIIIIPEYGVGLTLLLAADSGRFNTNGMRYSFHWSAIEKLLLDDKGLLKTIEQAAYEEAKREYTGEYLFVSKILDGDEGSRNPDPNSQIKENFIFSGMQVVRDHGPGLRIKRWISNETDFLQALMTVKLQMSRGQVDGAVAVARLYPIGNLRRRKDGRWAEDWRIWFEWEWENTTEEEPVKLNPPSHRKHPQPHFVVSPIPYTYPKPEEIVTPPARANPDYIEKDYPYNENRIPWEVWPEVLPGTMKDRMGLLWGLDKQKSSPPPEQPEELLETNEDYENTEGEVPAEEEESEQRGGQGFIKMPRRSTAITRSSDENAKTWSNTRKPRPPWGRVKYGGKDQLKNLSDRKKVDADLASEDTEDKSSTRKGNGKSDTFVNFTIKQAKAHGMDKLDEDGDDKFAYGEYEGVLLEGMENEEDYGYKVDVEWDGDDEDDNEFFIPDHPPHVLPIPIKLKARGFDYRPYSVDDDFEDTLPSTLDRDRLTIYQQWQVKKQWDQWKDIDDGVKDKKEILKRWGCADYNGFELQSWAGWSLGLVRFLRDSDSERRMIGIEIPALKVRLAKVVGQVLIKTARPKAQKENMRQLPSYSKAIPVLFWESGDDGNGRKDGKDGKDVPTGWEGSQYEGSDEL